MTKTLLILGVLSLSVPTVVYTVQPAQAAEDRRERRVRYEDLPGPVKQAFSRERGRDEIREVTEIHMHGKTTYRAEIEGRNNTFRTVRVNREGEIVSERNITPEGRRQVSLDSLSGPVRSAFLKRTDKYDRIMQVTRGKETWYVGFARNGEVYRVDSEGRVFDVEER